MPSGVVPSLSAMPVGVVPQYMKCILLWCLTECHAFWCGASLSAMPVCVVPQKPAMYVGVVPQNRPCLLVW